MRKIFSFLAFMVIWIIGCAIFDNFINFESFAYTMSYGYLVGIIGAGAMMLIYKP